MIIGDDEVIGRRPVAAVVSFSICKIRNYSLIVIKIYVTKKKPIVAYHHLSFNQWTNMSPCHALVFFSIRLSNQYQITVSFFFSCD